MAIALAVLMILAFATVVAAWLAARGRAQGDAAQRRWARVAQRRAPVEASARRSAESELLDHINDQIRTLKTERQRVTALVARGQRLRRDVVRSDLPTAAIARLDDQIDSLYERGRHLDGLTARYERHRDEIALACRTAEFQAELSRYQAERSTRFDGLSDATDELDEEATRLLDVADAEAELDNLLAS